ncbi:MAG: AI-2E family transporter [Anaerolineales bacterium]|nr:AI-2E family transporter [Anaerolineales bacterium]
MSDESPIPPPEYTSPPWGLSTKVVVAIVTMIFLVLVAYRFQSLIAQLVVAAIFAYILNPIVDLVDRNTSITRGTAILVAYLVVAAALIWAMVALGVAAFQQISALLNEVPQLIDNLTDFFQELTRRTEPITIGSLSIDPIIIPWDAITQQVIGLVEPVLSQSTQMVSRLAAGTVSLVGNFFFIFVISIYIAIEIPKLSGYVGDFAQTPGYRMDAERMTRQFGRIWSAYLRGQVILGLVIGFVVWLGLSVLGVQNALALGILSGLLEFVPLLGPIIGAAAAVTVAFFQPANYLGLVSWQHALLVLGLMFLIQQIENNLLVPRIVGDALDLHPILVMVAVFMGGSLAGILGAILAAPVLATLKLLTIYGWRKMFDMPPFPEPEPERPPPQPLSARLRRGWHKVSVRLPRRQK